MNILMGIRKNRSKVKKGKDNKCKPQATNHKFVWRELHGWGCWAKLRGKEKQVIYVGFYKLQTKCEAG
jgi:hypothetical protein